MAKVSKPRPSRRTACDICRYRRIKCDGNFGRNKEHTTCSNCASRGFDCKYGHQHIPKVVKEYRGHRLDNVPRFHHSVAASAADDALPSLQLPPSTASSTTTESEFPLSHDDISQSPLTIIGSITSSEPDFAITPGSLTTMSGQLLHPSLLLRNAHQLDSCDTLATELLHPELSLNSHTIYDIGLGLDDPNRLPSDFTQSSSSDDAETLIHEGYVPMPSPPPEYVDMMSPPQKFQKPCFLVSKRVLSRDNQYSHADIGLSLNAKHDLVRCGLHALKLRGCFYEYLKDCIDLEHAPDALPVKVMQCFGALWSVHPEATGRPITNEEMKTRLGDDVIAFRTGIQQRLLHQVAEMVDDVVYKDLTPDLSSCIAIVIFCTLQASNGDQARYPPAYIHDWTVQKMMNSKKGSQVWAMSFRHSPHGANVSNPRAFWPWYALDGIMALSTYKLPCFRPKDVYGSRDCNLTWLGEPSEARLCGLDDVTFALRDINILVFELYDAFLTPYAKSTLLDKPIPVFQCAEIIAHLQAFRQFHNYLFTYSFPWSVKEQHSHQTPLLAYSILWLRLWDFIRDSPPEVDGSFQGASESYVTQAKTIYSQIKLGVQQVCVDVATLCSHLMNRELLRPSSTGLYPEPTNIRSSLHLDWGVALQFVYFVVSGMGQLYMDFDAVDSEWPLHRTFSVIMSAVYEMSETKTQARGIYEICHEMIQPYIEENESTVLSTAQFNDNVASEWDEYWQVYFGEMPVGFSN